ncbi:MAG: hypothetical protein WA003_04875, partial [Desulfuromonadaceae bacterium]
MSRKPADKLRPDQTRQAIWDLIRKLKNFVLNDILFGISLSRDTVLDYLTGLEAAGFLVKQDDGPRYTLVRDNGQEAPRVRKDGTAVTQGLAREQMWRAMGIFSQKGKTFTVRDLTLFATTVTTPVAESDAKHYCNHLHQSGYLTLVKAGSPGKLALYRMPPSKWTGPRPVQIQRTRRCFDPN